MNELYKYDAIRLGLSVLMVFFFGVTINVFGQEPAPVPTATPVAVKDVQDVKPEGVKGVPGIGEDFRSDERNLPDIGRVGVDMLTQKPLGMREAIVKGLENNIDIEVTRQEVKLAEFDLKAADGSYEPRFSGQSYYDRSTAPNISIFSSNRSTTLGTFSNAARYEGYLRETGTTYYGEVSNQRQTTNNTISILSPQNNTSLKFGFVQPLLKGRRFDDRRRVIEIAKKNLSLTDTQFRQTAIDITANIQRAYWDLTYALKNLQVQRDGVRDAKEQLEHNKRLVQEGVLAPVDIIAAETQVANLELQVYAALETVNRSENYLKGLISG